MPPSPEPGSPSIWAPPYGNWGVYGAAARRPSELFVREFIPANACTEREQERNRTRNTTEFIVNVLGGRCLSEHQASCRLLYVIFFNGAPEMPS
jgi:hypothetical protein